MQPQQSADIESTHATAELYMHNERQRTRPRQAGLWTHARTSTHPNRALRAQRTRSWTIYTLSMLMQNGLSQGLSTTKQIQTLQQRKRQQCSTELQLWTAENASTQPRRSCQHSVGRMQMEPAEAAADSATWTVRCVAEMQLLEQFGQAATTNLLPCLQHIAQYLTCMHAHRPGKNSTQTTYRCPPATLHSGTCCQQLHTATQPRHTKLLFATSAAAGATADAHHTTAPEQRHWQQHCHALLLGCPTFTSLPRAALQGWSLVGCWPRCRLRGCGTLP